MRVERFIKAFSAEIDAGTAAIFAGAGFSCAAGFIDWRGLLRDIAMDLDLDVDRETDLIAVAQYHVNRHGGNRGHLNKAIIDEFPSAKSPTKNHRILARLPIQTWWTTNYDKLIERALDDEGRIPDVKYSKSQLPFTKPKRDATVYKMHGDVDHPSSAVLTRDDYESYIYDNDLFVNALSGDLVSKTFLFIGFSFTDPNLAHVLSQVRYRLKDNQRPHYAIFKSVALTDYSGDVGEYEYARRKQELILDDLRRYSINPIIVDEYSEIDEIIYAIYKKQVSRSVFVSSSADLYDPWGEETVKSFMAKLGWLLTNQGFKIVTGVGRGTGNALMTGAITAILQGHEKRLDHDIVIRPFPLHVPNELEREALWNVYRQDLIGRAGIALFLFGNKDGSDGPAAAMGMRREFEIARSKGLLLVPVGATNWMAADLARELMESDLAGYPEAMTTRIAALSEPTEDLARLLGPIIDLMDALANHAGSIDSAR